jgi:chondroitin sulfate proteoglycan 4
MVYLHDVATRQFGQLDVDKKRVMYVQTDMTTASDSMELLAWLPDSDTLMPGLELNVSVEPLLRMGNFSPVAGMRNKITLEVLDATPLAKLTGSNPGYQVQHSQ